MSTPARLFVATCQTVRVSDLEREADGLGVAATVRTRLAIDLASVIAVRETADWQQMAPSPNETTVEIDTGEAWTLDAPFADVFAAWRAWVIYASAPQPLFNNS